MSSPAPETLEPAPSQSDNTTTPPVPVSTAAEPIRPSSAGSNDGSQSSTSSSEVVVVESAKENEVVEEAEEVEKPVKSEESKPEPASPAPQAKETAIGAPPLPPTPSVEQAAASIAPKSVPSKSKELTKELRQQLPKCLTKTNIFVSRINKLMSSATGTDRVLMTISSSLTVLTAQFDKLASYRALAHSRNPEKVRVVPVGLLGYIVLPRRPEASRLVAVSARLKALASLISDVRIFMRLWGLFGMYEWLVATVQDPPKDATLRKITYLQIAANTLYQILENLAYLGQHKVLPVGKRRQSNYWLWSSRFWMAHVVLEFWRLKRDRDLSAKGKQKAEDTGEGEEVKWYDVVSVLNSDSKRSVWLRQLWSNLAYAPLTVHCSLERGALSRLSVGTFGAIAGLIGLQQAWRRTA
ncbi:hypothetical protein BDZ91DRAFT_738978 [Kalaharituber pfeilii]|nr:hypothetical protein BDZ91DRAFT_738978 [Kalaharituber pfeilii]